MQNNKGCVRIDMMMWLFPKMHNFLHIATQKKSVFWKPAFKKKSVYSYIRHCINLKSTVRVNERPNAEDNAHTHTHTHTTHSDETLNSFSVDRSIHRPVFSALPNNLDERNKAVKMVAACVKGHCGTSVLCWRPVIHCSVLVDSNGSYSLLVEWREALKNVYVVCGW